ncbi:hypothetical protein PV04_10127 [Phialophora macrospora]|uniref:Uncharacterized protein n=1 Tax=Phialophora macrospora TaxID=1851006 RepID=A0A0D2CDU1_9EURO|nr:hypothetical protein PV04_10127 [Phialophora macrospora]
MLSPSSYRIANNNHACYKTSFAVDGCAGSSSTARPFGVQIPLRCERRLSLRLSTTSRRWSAHPSAYKGRKNDYKLVCDAEQGRSVTKHGGGCRVMNLKRR